MNGTPLTLGLMGALALLGASRRGSRASAPITIADLSCGAGLASRGVLDGLAAHGIPAVVAYACDPWLPAVDTYRASIPEARKVDQTTTEEALASDRVPHVDLILAGPPCIRDSTLARSRRDLEDRDEEMSGIKEATRTIAFSRGRMIVLETNRGWDEWGRSHGFDVFRVSDHKLGGFTLRRRTFLLRGLEGEPTSGYPLRGWGDALPAWRGDLLSSDVHAKAKRARLARPSTEPALAVVGHGAAPLVFDAGGHQVHRCTPEEALRLQGFNEQQIRLRSPRVRDRQTLVGNGWPASYGRWVAACVARTLGANLMQREPVGATP